MKKIVLAIALMFVSCSGKVGPQVPSKDFTIEWVADHFWNMERGPYEFGILFKHAPEEPVCVQGYICYSLVNDGACRDENLRFHSDGVLPPYIHGVVRFTEQDYIYATGLRDQTEERDFFSRYERDSQQVEPLAAGGAEFAEGQVIMLIQVYELVEDDLGNAQPGKLIKQARHMLKLDCTSCSN